MFGSDAVCIGTQTRKTRRYCTSVRWLRNELREFLAQRTKRQPQRIGHNGDNDPDPRHLKPRRPPRADRDQRFQRADGKVRDQTDAEGSSYRSNATGKEEWNDGNESANGSGNSGRDRGSPVIRKPVLRQAEFALRHRLHELFGLLGEALRHFLRLFRSESLQLVEERHFFDFLLWIFFDLGALARDFCLVYFCFTF